ncbi:MAG: hypothetical protein ACYCOR_11840 [Acidobacteriaceae bacterium]
MRKKMLFACLCVFGLLAAGVARADSITYDIGVGNTAISGYPGPYGTLDVSVTGGDATFTLTGLTQSSYTYLFGGEGVLGLNLSNTDVTLTGLSWTGGNGSTAIKTDGSGNLSSFGTFDYLLKDHGGFPEAVSSLTFTLDPITGMFTSAASVLTPNSKGYLAAGHVFVSGDDCTGACATGYAANSPTTPVIPEPPSLVLLGTGLLVLAGAFKMKLLMA